MLHLAALKPAIAGSSSAEALRQPSYSRSHLTPPRFDKYFTTEREHCPGAPGSTLKECANERTAQIAQRVEDEDPLTQLYPGKVQSEQQKWQFQQPVTELQDTFAQFWVLAIPAHHVVCPFPGQCPQPCPLPSNALALPMPTALSRCNTAPTQNHRITPSPLSLKLLSFDYKLFWVKMIFYYVLVQCPEKWGSDLKALP